ncbi:MAG: hypothetical protein O9267_05600 [Flavobacterium sp.]|uniref:hypothetical protein n=1 Tax=Flavobacterium sp. TaxID=239 RepID=UPI0022C7AAD8|nr:hypothetical protein [Flavobacterium sp.]MCZ8197059.1 hypothetical protein [Flavobacterium sp.]
MSKRTFNLTITKQSRALTVIFLLPIIVFISIVIKFESDSFILGGTALLFFLFLSYYFLIGELTVSIYDEKIHFEWKKKLFFNYRDIETIKESDIEKIVVDDGKYLRQISTSNISISLGTSRIKPKDSSKLISYFKSKYTVINSWENISKSRLNSFYKINIVVLILVGIIFISLVFIKGFQPKLLFIFLFCVPQLIMYGKQMKDTINKK